ncbi:MAG: fused MFS/spermidine synthase [Acidobacteriota bacterium]
MKALPHLLLYISGFASLVYQVLWMRQLGLLFGSSALASAGTLAVFFGGLAIGGAVWGRRAPRVAKPLGEYGLLEIGVGLSGVLYFGLLPLYAASYTGLHDLFEGSPALLLLAKLILAAIVLLPPATLMGGTLPLMTQHVITQRQSLGRAGVLLYAVNTLGAASGALAAGFWLPRWLGFRTTYLIAVFASLLIGAIAWRLRDQQSDSATTSQPTKDEKTKGKAKRSSSKQRRRGQDPESKVSLNSPRLVAAAIASGALAIGLEVLWTRMFQQVLQNSVYTYTIILVTFLIALSLGAFAARGVARLSIEPWTALALLSVAAGAGALATPFLFFDRTDGMRYLGAGEYWSEYVVSVFSGAAAVLLLPAVAIGTVFPYLLRVAENSGAAGLVMGRLSALNTAGGIVGSLLAGFVLLSAIGLWASVQWIAIVYFLLALWCAGRRPAAMLPIACLLLAFTVGDPSSLPGVRLNEETEKLLASWEGRDGYVAVIERNGTKRIKVNNFYALGSSAAQEHEQNQTLIPLMPHPAPRQLFYLGMGTGITAGAGLRLPAEAVTVAELVPEVVDAAADFFSDEAMGLFSDARARILTGDGRNELRGRAQRYDAILADLFLPWRAGVGNLYSLDHYNAARSRLNPGGIYVQWIPLYQVTEFEFWTITRTFLEAFPHVHVWRGDFYKEKPILALVGSDDDAPLDPFAVVRNGEHISGRTGIDPATFLAVTLPFYAGNLGESREIVPSGPIHTDDRPVIEYRAPISHRNARAGRDEWFVGEQFLDLLKVLLEATPPARDPYLARLEPAARQFVTAGLKYHTGAVLDHLGQKEAAAQQLDEFLSLLPVPVQFETSGATSTSFEEP